eukprot:GFUD01093632.1.p1 GENE.GFUD01093632.1~~GFUD01093632.1.p1  ORF type:complete len:125 (+),score=26.78 GFUD01093632.1:52-426(+)
MNSYSTSQHNESPSSLTKRHKSPRSNNSQPDHRRSLDQRTKLGRRRSARSRSRSGSPLRRRSTKSSSVRSNRSVTKLVHSKLRSDRSRSRSPTRSSRRQTKLLIDHEERVGKLVVLLEREVLPR